MAKHYRILVFGKKDCAKCKQLNQRIDDLLAGPDWSEFEKCYYEMGTIDGLVAFGCAERSELESWASRLEELGIEQIPAYSPQAKGRIERIWRTCQDRLVSELRLVRATSVQHANTVLARFCADYNQRFARAAAESVRDFRSLPRRFDLARCLSLRYQRVVSADHTVTLGALPIALPPLPGQCGYARQTVELSHQLDGTLRIFRGDQLLRVLSVPLQEHAERRPPPVTKAQKRKTTIPRIYNLGGRPALAAVT